MRRVMEHSAGRPFLTIERKILLPFLFLGVLTTLLFSFLLYRNGREALFERERRLAEVTISLADEALEHGYETGWTKAQAASFLTEYAARVPGGALAIGYSGQNDSQSRQSNPGRQSSQSGQSNQGRQSNQSGQSNQGGQSNQSGQSNQGGQSSQGGQGGQSGAADAGVSLTVQTAAESVPIHTNRSAKRTAAEGAAATPDTRVLLERNDARYGFQIAYRMNEAALWEELLREQKYTVLAVIAELILVIQASILLADNLSEPLRRLTYACRRFSAVSKTANAEQTEDSEDNGIAECNEDSEDNGISEYTEHYEDNGISEHTEHTEHAGSIETIINAGMTNHADVREADAGFEMELEFADRRDEIGQLARSFSRMLLNLQAYMAELTAVKDLNQSIVENLPVAVIVYDRGDRPVLSNSRARSLMTKTEYRADGKTLSALLAEKLKQKKTFYAPNDAIVLWKGSDRQQTMELELGVWRLVDGSGKDSGTMCTIDDVTYRNLMERQTVQNEKLIYSGQQAVELAHEIRNPLAGIRMGIQLLGRHLAAMAEQERQQAAAQDHMAQDRKLCSTMIGEVDRINLLVENLCSLNRKRELKKDTVEVGEVFRELLLLYDKVAENSRIKLSAFAPDTLCIYADRTALKQVLINLINNSLHAVKRDGHIELRAEETKQQIVLSVRDDGPGLPETEADAEADAEAGADAGAEPAKNSTDGRDTADSRMRQNAESAARKFRSEGVGLSIVKKLLTENQASFRLENRKDGRGALAEIGFPR